MVFNTGCLMTFCARALRPGKREKDNGKKKEEIRVARSLGFRTLKHSFKKKSFLTRRQKLEEARERITHHDGERESVSERRAR